MSGDTDTNSNTSMTRTVSNRITQTVSRITTNIRQHYFNEGYIPGTISVAQVGLCAIALFWVLAFFTFSFDPIPHIFFATGILSFVTAAIIHLVLWVAGIIHRSGFIKPTVFTVKLIVAVSGMCVVGGFLLYGWVIPLIIGIMAYIQLPTFVANAIAPFATVIMLVFVFAWYSKGLSIVEGM